MLRYNETETIPSRKILRKVREYARYGGGIHRMNTVGCIFYEFTAYKDETGKEDFCGGWSHTMAHGSVFSYALNMNDGRIKPVSYWVNQYKFQDKLSKQQRRNLLN